MRAVKNVPRRTRWRTGLWAFAISALVLMSAVGGYILLVATVPLPAARIALADSTTKWTPDAIVDWPDGTASSLSIVSVGNLGSSGTDDPLPMASMTKAVTAMVVLDAHPLAAGEEGPSITFTAQDEGLLASIVAQNGVVVPVSAGQSLSQRQILEGMMLPSANNLAESLALWAFGSSEAYLDAARAWLNSQGLRDISVADASGLSADSVGSAADLVALAALITEDPALSSIVSEASASLPGIGEIVNTNDLLGTAGVDGIKTGTTDAAGACLLYSATRSVDGSLYRFVGVAMGASDHTVQNEQIATALDDAVAGLSTVTAVSEGSTWGSLRTAWGGSADLVAGADVEVTAWSAVEITSRASLDPGVGAEKSTASWIAYADLGTVSVSSTADTGLVVGDTSSSADLLLSQQIQEPDLGWRIAHPALLFGWDTEW